MARGTSPSMTCTSTIATFSTPEVGTFYGSGGYRIAFQASTGTLWTYDDGINFPGGNAVQINSDTGLGVDGNFSPARRPPFFNP